MGNWLKPTDNKKRNKKKDKKKGYNQEDEESANIIKKTIS